MTERFISVIMPLAIGWEPVYRTEYCPEVGDRVDAPLSGRIYTGVVSAVFDTPPDIDPGKIKTARRPLSALEKISPEEIAFWRKLASYYLCSVGEVYKAAYPSVRQKGEEVSSREREAMELKLEKTRLKLAAARKDSTRERYSSTIRALEAGLSRLGAMSCPLPETESNPASERISAALAEGKPVLYSGADPTAVAKMLIPLIAGTLREGRSVLYLVPEIASGEEMGETLSEAFPDLVVFHSRIGTGAMRVAQDMVRMPGPRLILGTRSALFLPLRELGLVIVSEEHSIAYKQDSPAPRYNARDAAIILSKVHGANILLTAFTPSLDSLYNARSGRFTALEDSSPGRNCRVMVIDTSAERAKRGMVGPFSRKLLEQIVKSGGKVLIIEKYLESELRSILPDEGDKLVFGAREGMYGTDLTGISVIASVKTDRYFAGQDFRSDEKAYQILRLLGLYSESGLFIIQTAHPEHPVLKCFALQEDPSDNLLAQRHAAMYPPYTRMTDIRIRDINEKRLRVLAYPLGELLRQNLQGVNILGPFTESDDSGEMIIRVLFPRDKYLSSRKEALRSLVDGYEKDRHYTGHIILDTDPR